MSRVKSLFLAWGEREFVFLIEATISHLQVGTIIYGYDFDDIINKWWEKCGHEPNYTNTSPLYAHKKKNGIKVTPETRIIIIHTAVQSVDMHKLHYYESMPYRIETCC